MNGLSARIELMHEGERVVLAVEEAILGRVASCSIQVTHPLVSRRHCRILATQDGIFVEDLGSSNGTYVNGGRAAGRVRMCVGDVLRIGNEGPEFRLIAGTVGGRDVAALDPEAMEKTMMAGDPGVADLAARIRVAPRAGPALDEDLTRESPLPLGDDDEPTRAVGDSLTTSSIPVAVPMEPGDETGVRPRHPMHAERTGRTALPPAQPRTPPHAPPSPTAPPATPPPAAPRAVTEPAHRARTTGLVPGLLLGLVVGLLLAAIAAVFSPWGDTLAGWPEDARHHHELPEFPR